MPVEAISDDKPILLVDDSEEVIKTLKRLLYSFGDIDVADNGQDALRRVGSRHYDMIISDVEMRRMSGFTFFTKAMEMDASIRDRFLFFSSSVPVEQSNFFTQNKVRFIMKPGSVQEILDAAKTILNVSAQKSPNMSPV